MRTRISLCLPGALAILIAVTACAPEPGAESEPAGEAESGAGQQPDLGRIDGAALYQGYCASCHGSNASGNGPVAAGLNMPVPDLRTLQLRNNGVFPRERIEAMIEGREAVAAHGTADMPVWGHAFYRSESLTGETQPQRYGAARVQAIVSYLESIQTQP